MRRERRTPFAEYLNDMGRIYRSVARTPDGLKMFGDIFLTTGLYGQVPNLVDFRPELRDCGLFILDRLQVLHEERLDDLTRALVGILPVNLEPGMPDGTFEAEDRDDLDPRIKRFDL